MKLKRNPLRKAPLEETHRTDSRGSRRPRFIVGALAAALSFASFAAETSLTASQLEEKLRFYAEIDTLDVDFTQVKELKEMEMRMNSEGHLTLKRPDSILWSIRKPAPLKVELNPKGIRIISGEGANASIQEFSADQMPKDQAASSLHDLTAWLRLDAKALTEQYSVSAIAKNQYRFLPKKAGPFQSLTMSLSSAGHLTKLVLEEGSGDRMTLSFGKPRVKKRKKNSLEKDSSP